MDAQADFQTGFRQTASMGMEGVYLKDATPSVEWDRWFTIDPIDLVPFTYTLNGEGSATVSLVPQIDVRLYGAAGLYLNTDPRLTLSGSATVTDGTLTEASWLFGAYADVNAGLSVIGLSNDQLPALPPFRFFTREWGDSYAVDPGTPGGGDEVSLAILRQPLSQIARVGDPVTFAVEASGSGSLTYQWYQDGVLIPGATKPELRLSRISSDFFGDYFVRVGDDNGTVDSNLATLNIVTEGSTGPIPPGYLFDEIGLIAYFPFDGSIDEFPNKGFSQTPVGAVSFVEGVEGQAVRFDGNGAYLETGIFQTTESFSVSISVKNENLNKSDFIGTEAPWRIAIEDGSGESWLSGKGFEFGYNFRDSRRRGIGYSYSQTNKWVHLVATYTPGEACFYVNGLRIGTTNWSAMDESVNEIRLACKQTLAGVQNGAFYQGAIDELRIYGRVLSANEALALYQASSG